MKVTLLYLALAPLVVYGSPVTGNPEAAPPSAPINPLLQYLSGEFEVELNITIAAISNNDFSSKQDAIKDSGKKGIQQLNAMKENHKERVLSHESRARTSAKKALDDDIRAANEKYTARLQQIEEETKTSQALGQIHYSEAWARLRFLMETHLKAAAESPVKAATVVSTPLKKI